MSLPPSVAKVLKQHATLEVESIDRMYLNSYQRRLQTDRGVAAFFRFHRGAIFASSALMDPISKPFIATVDCFVRREKLPRSPLPRVSVKMTSLRSIGCASTGPKGLLWSPRHKRRRPGSAPRIAATPKRVRSKPGSCGP